MSWGRGGGQAWLAPAKAEARLQHSKETSRPLQALSATGNPNGIRHPAAQGWCVPGNRAQKGHDGKSCAIIAILLSCAPAVPLAPIARHIIIVFLFGVRRPSALAQGVFPMGVFPMRRFTARCLPI